MSEEELRKLYGVINNAWKLLKQFSNPIDDDSFWDELILKIDEVHKENGSTDFSKDILLAVASEIDRRYKNKQEIIQ